MPEGITAEKLLNNIMETLHDGTTKKKSVSFFEEENSTSVGTQFNRLFGRQKPVHNILGGGKSADVLLWRNKKTSSSVLVGATVVWVLFEWLNYHFFSLACFGLVLLLVAQFVWSNGSGLVNRSASQVPRLVLPDELFVNIAKTVGAEVNKALGLLQNIACRGNIKQFATAVGGLLVAAMIGSWCNFLTVIYLGFVSAQTLPVLYEKYDDKIDSFVYSVLDQLQHNYKKLDAGVLSRIPTRRFRGNKYE